MKTVYEGKPEGTEKHLDRQLPPVVYIWRDLVLYIGQLPPNKHHRIAVDTFSINIEQPYSITTDEGQSWENIRSVLWLANCPHQSVFGDDVMVFCFMEPTLRICKIIKQKMYSDKGEYLVKFKNEGEAIDTFTYLYNQRPDTDTAWEVLCSLFNPSHTNHTDYMNHNLDRRIHAVTTMIKQRIEHNYSIQDLADHVNLSTSRLEHLFKQQTNISIARYRMWTRIKQFAKPIGLNKTLTEAALETGFVDAAHFNRTFKYIVGMIPSTFFLYPTKISILVADDF
jgi:AraC-like DNA-binding protein